MTALANDPLDGTGKYRALQELGRGGMGEVFLAEHIALGSRVVVKLLHAELSSKNTLVDRMRIEAQACARLNHPNIVRVTDFDRTPSGRPYFVMEYLPGKALGDLVKERGGFLPVAEAVDVVLQSLEGLSAAHAQGLVHRDIKLDNLFVCEAAAPGAKPLVKILDFGVAKVLDGAGSDAPAQLAVPTGTGVVVGTPRFFAPEQARGKPLDARADIYAMGLVLYSLLAGRGPFDEAKNITEMAKAHVFKAPEPPSHFAKQAIPDKLDAIVLRAIAKKPEQRFQSASEMSAMLSRVTESPQPASAPAQPPPGGLAKTAYMPPDARQPPPSAGAQQPPPSAEITGSEAPTNRMQPAHAPAPAAGHPPAPSQPGGYPPAPHAHAPAPPAARPPAPSQDLPPTAPLPGSTQVGAAPLAPAPTPPPAVGPKRYSAGLAVVIVLIALLVGGAAAAAVLRML